MRRAQPTKRWRRAARASLATVPCALVALACISFPPRLRRCEGPLRSTHEIAGDFTRHERIRVRGGRVDESFGLVLQKRGAKLVVLGTNAFGAKVFAVTQVGDHVETKSFVGPALSVPPENILRDLHRAYFLEEGERTAEPVPEGIRVTSRCGYESLLVRVSEQP
jgi:hypothetical protein